ncbi:hypothetical protein N9977_00225 [bacterium]|jgi:hypothetical protein|nr:hypothetical protein [bacterium]|tara:strand:- start:278 stop:478 length:201 start_codon:yes stop_codon:yes gene_type:complete
MPDLHHLDKKVGVLAESVNDLKSNHLKHLQAQIDRLDRRIWAILMGIAVQLAVALTGVVLLMNGGG